MPKPSQQEIINDLIKDIEKGKPRAFVLGKAGKKWGISRTTFDRHWQKANQQHAERQRKAKEEADRAYIAAAGEHAKEAFMSEIEAKKNLTDIARGNMADYMVVRKVERRQRIEVGLQAVIDQLNEKIAFEDEYASLAGYNEEEGQRHAYHQSERRREVLRYELLLKKDPSATTIIDGPTYWEEVAELDLVKIVQDKEQGKIKSFAHTPSGIKVEMYCADTANIQILKLHGSFEKDNKQKAVTLPQMTDNQFTELLKAAREAKTNSGK